MLLTGHLVPQKIQVCRFFQSFTFQNTKVLQHDTQQKWNKYIFCALKNKESKKKKLKKNKESISTSIEKALKKRLEWSRKVTATKSDILTFYHEDENST